MNCCHVRMLAALAALIVGGCQSSRKSIVPLVEDIGCEVSTKYRYRLSCVYLDGVSQKVAFDGSVLGKYYPQVFSSTGLPFVLRMNMGKPSGKNGWTMVLALCTCGIVPEFTSQTMTYNGFVELVDASDSTIPFGIMNVNDHASSLLPTALLFYNGAAESDGHRVFGEGNRYSDVHDSTSWTYLLSIDPVMDSNWKINGFEMKATASGQQALAYALAVKLKELEDSGKVDAMLKKKAERRSVAPSHRTIRFERDQGSAFSYSFGIEMTSAPSDVDAAVDAILRELTVSVKDNYLDAHQNADMASLEVSIPHLKVDGLRIEGRATVLTIKPSSLFYDANTRRGKLSVRFNAGQVEEARAWIRKNIETLARDKNIALTTGELPPKATYYSLGEKIDGNVMEIEFRTE